MPLKLQTPKEISKKLTTLYNRAEHLTAYLNQTEFTITIKFKRISQKEIETNFMQIRDWVEVLDKSPFEVEFQEVAYSFPLSKWECIPKFQSAVQVYATL